MADDSRFVDALLAAGTVALFFVGVLYVAYRVVKWARRQQKRAYIIGAALAPFIAMGNVGDPDFRIVQEAKQLKKREEDNPGDPPDGDDDSSVPEGLQVKPEPAHGELEPKVAAAAKRHRWSPVLARALALVLGLVALTTSVVQSMILLSDFYGPAGRDIRKSFSAFEWVAMYLASALLLASMVELFRLKRVSVWLFAGYLALGGLLSTSYLLMREPTSYLDLRVTFVTVPVALLVLAYMRRSSKQAKPA